MTKVDTSWSYIWSNKWNLYIEMCTCLQVSKLKDIISFLLNYFSNWASKFSKSLFFIEQEPVDFGILVLSLDFMWLSAQWALISLVMKVLRHGSWPRWGRRHLQRVQEPCEDPWILAFLESYGALGEKLCGQCNDLLDQWLPHRQATGCLSGQCDSVLSDVVVIDTRAPLLPLLFNLYTTEVRRCLHSLYGSKRRWWWWWWGYWGLQIPTSGDRQQNGLEI